MDNQQINKRKSVNNKQIHFDLFTDDFLMLFKKKLTIFSFYLLAESNHLNFSQFINMFILVYQSKCVLLSDYIGSTVTYNRLPSLT